MSLARTNKPEEIIDEETLWEENGRYWMRDFVIGLTSKGHYFGIKGDDEAGWKWFWSYLEENPIPTVQEFYDNQNRPRRTSWEDDPLMAPIIRGCPNKIANINHLVAALNATRDKTEYKRLINEFILTVSPEAATNTDSLFHRDV